jgi:hypothetical protein
MRVVDLVVVERKNWLRKILSRRHHLGHVVPFYWPMIVLMWWEEVTHVIHFRDIDLCIWWVPHVHMETLDWMNKCPIGSEFSPMSLGTHIHLSLISRWGGEP